MIYTNVTDDVVLSRQPMLERVNFSNNIGFQDIINDSYSEMLLDIRNTDLDNKKLQIPLELLNTGEITGISTGDQSEKDFIERSMIIAEVVSGKGTYTLYGTNSVTPSASDWTLVTDISVENAGTFDFLIKDYYDYYRLDKTNAEACNAKVMLVESVYNLLHLYKTFINIYDSLSKLPDDSYSVKAGMYENRYQTLLSKGRKFYDANADGVIDGSERTQNINSISLSM